MEQKTLDRLHETELEIMDFIKNVCEVNNLEYCLLYGSVLGAYRHGGFIPWDDDMDVGLPRADYEKFKQIVLADDGPFEFQDSCNEKNYNLIYGKVRKKGTLFLENAADVRLEKNGIFVDVFPLDNVKKISAGFKIKNKKINYYKHILRFKTMKKWYRKRDGALKFYIDSVISLPAEILPDKSIYHRMEKLAKGKCSLGDAVLIAEFDEKGGRQLIPKEVYFPTKELAFENRKYRVPGRVEEYLESVYGKDYMTLPPEGERYTHDPAELVF